MHPWNQSFLVYPFYRKSLLHIALTQPSWHGAIHALGGLFIFVVLAAALVVFARFFLARKERWWAFYCLASAVLLILFFFGGINNAVLMARFLRLAACRREAGVPATLLHAL
jgi:type II secretory pathway component PulF